MLSVIHKWIWKYRTGQRNSRITFNPELWS